MRSGPNPSGKGTIPDITNSTKSWLKEDIAEYLSSGFTPDFDVAGGHMAEVIEVSVVRFYGTKVVLN
jgi:hypothetical protein